MKIRLGTIAGSNFIKAVGFSGVVGDTATLRIRFDDRRVSTTLRHMLTEFSEFFHVSWTGLLIHASVGTAGGLGALRTKRSG